MSSLKPPNLCQSSWFWMRMCRVVTMNKWRWNICIIKCHKFNPCPIPANTTPVAWQLVNSCHHHLCGWVSLKIGSPFNVGAVQWPYSCHRHPCGLAMSLNGSICGNGPYSCHHHYCGRVSFHINLAKNAFRILANMLVSSFEFGGVKSFQIQSLRSWPDRTTWILFA